MYNFVHYTLQPLHFKFLHHIMTSYYLQLSNMKCTFYFISREDQSPWFLSPRLRTCHNAVQKVGMQSCRYNKEVRVSCSWVHTEIPEICAATRIRVVRLGL